jgi:hypothetical protein
VFMPTLRAGIGTLLISILVMPWTPKSWYSYVLLTQDDRNLCCVSLCYATRWNWLIHHDGLCEALIHRCLLPIWCCWALHYP